MKQSRPSVNNVDTSWGEEWRRRKGRKEKRTKKEKGVLAARSANQLDPSSVCLNPDHWYYHSFPSLHVPHHLDLSMISSILIPIFHQNQFFCPDPADSDPNYLPDVMMIKVQLQLQSELFSSPWSLSSWSDDKYFPQGVVMLEVQIR